MKKLIVGTIAVAIICCGVIFAQAQNIAGNWQSTLKANTDLRVVVKITKAESGKLAAVFYSIDQAGRGIGASAVVVQGSSVKLSFVAMDATYEGTLSADGKSIAGNFTQGGKSIPLNLVRSTGETAWAIPEAPVPVPPMAANANPVFEVATIKPSDPDKPGKAYLGTRTPVLHAQYDFERPDHFRLRVACPAIGRRAGLD